MKRLFDNLFQAVGRMTPSQILMGALVIAAVIVGTVLIAGWAKSQYFVPLYSGLSSEDAGKVIEKLKELNVSYQIAGGGTAISVPSDQVYETRMKLATSGLPSPQNIGYSLLDQTNIGMTDFLQKINYRRALEGELARTITGLAEVAAARVHLVIPEDRLFTEDQAQPSASVVLKLRGAGSLNKRQIQGVAYLVASSVEGMSPEHVTIINYDGTLMSGAQISDESAMLSATQFDMRKNVESYLEQKAQSMLSSVIGQGKATVRVTAELNFEKNNTQIEQYDPDLVAIRSEQRTSQRGTESATDPGQPPTQTANNSNNAEDVITNYEVSKTVTSIIGEVGAIKRLTVAVIVDGTYKENQTAEGDQAREYVPRSPEEMTRLAAIIKNAVGFADTRGDLFEIVNVPFDNTQMEIAKEQLDNTTNLTQYLYYGKKIGFVVVLLVGFLYVKKVVKRAFSAIAKMSPATSAPSMMATPQSVEIIQKPQKPKLIDTMKTQVKGKNEEIAKVIKTMMAEQ